MRTPIRILVLLAPLQAAAQSPQPPSVAELKSMYLACSHAARRGELGRAGIMECSVVYEELKRRAFDGDFIRLLAWSRGQAAQEAARDEERAALARE